MSVYNFISTLGIGTLIFLAWLFSSNRKAINWKLVGWGLLFQCIFAYFVFQAEVGFTVFIFINGIVNKLLSFAKDGMYFLFGVLSIGPGEVGPEGEKSLGFILAFQAFPTIVFFSAFMSLATIPPINFNPSFAPLTTASIQLCDDKYSPFTTLPKV